MGVSILSRRVSIVVLVCSWGTGTGWRWADFVSDSRSCKCLDHKGFSLGWKSCFLVCKCKLYFKEMQTLFYSPIVSRFSNSRICEVPHLSWIRKLFLNYGDFPGRPLFSFEWPRISLTWLFRVYSRICRIIIKGETSKMASPRNITMLSLRWPIRSTLMWRNCSRKGRYQGMQSLFNVTLPATVNGFFFCGVFIQLNRFLWRPWELFCTWPPKCALTCIMWICLG